MPPRTLTPAVANIDERSTTGDHEPTKVQVHFISAATATQVANRVWDMASPCATSILILHGEIDGHRTPPEANAYLRLLELVMNACCCTSTVGTNY
ncbi:hypothetical protein E2P81_ATG04518 [Venturia nashicola]|nr:hypothetical protein E2P81_ATG04518 [Venturia nashicola]